MHASSPRFGFNSEFFHPKTLSHKSAWVFRFHFMTGMWFLFTFYRGKNHHQTTMLGEYVKTCSKHFIRQIQAKISLWYTYVYIFILWYLWYIHMCILYLNINIMNQMCMYVKYVHCIWINQISGIVVDESQSNPESRKRYVLPMFGFCPE